jgi:hypothetical protein
LIQYSSSYTLSLYPSPSHLYKPPGRDSFDREGESGMAVADRSQHIPPNIDLKVVLWSDCFSAKIQVLPSDCIKRHDI